MNDVSGDVIDNELSRRIVVTAALCGAAGVLIGAFGAHGLDGFLESRGHSAELIRERLDVFDVGVRYHLVHAVALLALAGIPIGSVAGRKWVARLMLLGLLLFSGSLYLLVITDTPVLGAITPLGGLCWVFAWLLLSVLAVRRVPSAGD